MWCPGNTWTVHSSEELQSPEVPSSFTGVLLVGSLVVAMVWANLSPSTYLAVVHHHLEFPVSTITPLHTVQEWINNGLMAIFFLGVGFFFRMCCAVCPVFSFGCLVFFFARG